MNTENQEKLIQFCLKLVKSNRYATCNVINNSIVFGYDLKSKDYYCSFRLYASKKDGAKKITVQLDQNFEISISNTNFSDLLYDEMVLKMDSVEKRRVEIEKAKRNDQLERHCFEMLNVVSPMFEE